MKKVFQRTFCNMEVCWVFLFLLLQARGGSSFSNGAPMSACQDDMVPRHGFSPQQGEPPVEVVMDQEEMSPETYLRVTIRSRTAFKGFLIRAESKTESHLGSWYIPYLADTSYLSESQYLHCGDVLQSAVTHSGRTNNIWVVSFQWRPPQHFSGPVRFRATIVESYRVYWVNITSSQIMVIPGDEKNNVIEVSDERQKPSIDRSDVLGDYELISDEDYYDMKVSETQTLSDTQGFQGFTVLPISENVVQDQDHPDQTDGNSHDTDKETGRIDPGKVAPALPHEISEEQTIKVPTRPYEGKSSEKPRGRPSILMTPPVRPRNKKLSSTSGPTVSVTTTKKSMTKLTTITTSTTTTTTTTTTITTTTSTTTTPLKTVTLKVEGGIIVNARRRNSKTTKRTILEPKFIFTTISTPTPSPDTSTAATSSLATTLGEQENTRFSHLFDLNLTPDQGSDDQLAADSQTEIVIETIGQDPAAEVPYHHVESEAQDSQDSTTESTDSKVPTYDDLEVIYSENITTSTTTTKPHLKNDSTLPSDLYDVKYSENATEVILMGEVTELERMPRDNLDNLEPLEGAYNRLEAQYGGWKNAGGELSVFGGLILSALILTISQDVSMF